MKVTPLDIQQQHFKSSWRGYNRQEVEAFLDLVSSEFEALIRESTDLKDQLRRALTRITEYEEKEKTLKEAMMMAQKASQDIRQSAKKEAELIKSEAEVQAERLIEGTKNQSVQLQQEINELKRQRLQFESSLRSVKEGLQPATEVGRAGGVRLERRGVGHAVISPVRWRREPSWLCSARRQPLVEGSVLRRVVEGRSTGCSKRMSVVCAAASRPSSVARHRAAVHMPWAIARGNPNARAVSGLRWMRFTSPDTDA